MKNKLSLALSAFFGATISLLLFQFFFNNTSKIINKTEVQDIQDKEITESDFEVVKSTFNNLVPKEMDFTDAAQKTVNSVVHIMSEYSQNYHSDPLMDFFWGPGGTRGARAQVATGSGVIISEDGYIITNNHVIDDADKISITLNDGRELSAELIGTDPSTDLALLKVEEQNMSFTSFGNSDNVQLGDWVLAVGNPFNLTSTVTAGIVSAKARNINILKSNANENIFPLESFIQTDAAVNPGNSGGALVDPNGKLIGINTAIASKTGSYSGYSFAIPSNIALKVVNDLKSYGMVQRAFIGVVIQDVTQNIMDELELSDTKGVLVANLSNGGAAIEAGIKINDIILKVDNIEVNDVPELQEKIGRFKPGDVINLIVRRNNKNLLINVTLRNESGNTEIINKRELEKESIIHGALFIDIDLNTKKRLNIKEGFKVQSIENGKLKDAGLKTGFIITHIDKEPLESKKQLIDLLMNNKGGILIEGIYSNGTKGYFGFGL
jgi:Do/DeqQ family serine protease